MSLSQSHVRYTVTEYLALERESEERHECLDGQIYAIAGESGEHADICTNLVGKLSAQLRGKPGCVRSKDIKLRGDPMLKSYQTVKALFSYPDVVGFSAASTNMKRRPRCFGQSDGWLRGLITNDWSSGVIKLIDYGKAEVWDYESASHAPTKK
jgi:hypothetical protein